MSIGTLPVRLTLASAMIAIAVAPAFAQRSHAMAIDCRVDPNTPMSRQKADQWVQAKLNAFMPTAEQGLRMKSLELQAEQVKLAFYAISSTCEKYRAGSVAKSDADLWLSGFEDTIATFVHDIGNDAYLLAAKGQVSDINAIRNMLTDVGAVGRQAALLGEEQLADESQKKLVQSLVAFSMTFQTACYEQSFDPQIALAVDRQNQILGTGIDVRPCAYRRFTAAQEAGGLSWSFSHCGLGYGDWKMTIAGIMRGTGSGTIAADSLSGAWSASETRDGVRVEYSGDMRILPTPDPSPANKVPNQLEVNATKGTVSADGQVISRPLSFSGMTAVIKPTDKPCKHDEQ